MHATVQEVNLLKVPMAGIEFGMTPQVMETLLGSCIGIAIWDRTTGHGGLAHIVLPTSDGVDVSSPGKFADTAVCHMRETLVKRGANPLGLRAKITGGARMFGPASKENVGTRNASATLEYLAEAKIAVVAQHIGGDAGRVIHFSLADGSVTVMVRRDVVAVI